MNFSNSGSPKFGGGNNQQLSIGGPKANVPVQKISQAQIEERRKKVITVIPSGILAISVRILTSF